MIKTVTFDSNVWRKVVTPDFATKDPYYPLYNDLHSHAKNGRIKGYLSEVIFNLEAIPKKMRTQYFGTYKAKSEFNEIDSPNSETIACRVQIGPNPEGHPGNSDYLKKHLKDALELDFLLLSSPRIGMTRSPDISRSMFGNRSDEEMRAQQELFFEVADVVSELGCGIAVAKELGKNHAKEGEVWYEGLLNVPAPDRHLVPKAIAEWADGDAVAAHVGYQLDYFCTLDKAVGAGPRSVFSAENRKYLSDRYDVKFVTPEDLCNILKSTD